MAAVVLHLLDAVVANLFRHFQSIPPVPLGTGKSGL
jgi:hypothetical protein